MPRYKQVFNPIAKKFDFVNDSGILFFKEGVSTYSSLPISGNAKNDARFTNDTGHLYVWSLDASSGSLTDWADQGDVLDNAGGGGSVTWGDITGTLSAQTDLQTALDGKANTSHNHDSRYYTETELNAGQLDNRYYTESEVDSLLHNAVTVSAAPLTLSGQEITFNYDTDEFQLNSSDLQIKLIDCSKISINTLGTSTYENQCDFNKLFGSAGRATGGIISNNGDGTVDVTSGTGFIKATDDDTANLLSFNWAAASNISIPSDSTKYIGIEYNAGSPQIISKDSFTWDLDTEFPLGAVVNETINGISHVSVYNNPWWVTDGVTNIINALRSFGLIHRDEFEGGLSISVTGTRNIAVTSGRVWSGLNYFCFTGLDTSVSGTFEYYWYSSTNGWQETDATQISVTQYNDITSATLQDISVNKYCNIWVYGELKNGVPSISLIYPQNQYTSLAEAEVEPPPSTLPTHTTSFGLLLGKILIRKNNDTPIKISSAFDTVFNPSLIVNHNNLASLQGGIINEYFHLTSSEYTEFSTWLEDVTLVDGGEIQLGTNTKLQFRDSAIYINSNDDGHLDLNADISIDINNVLRASSDIYLEGQNELRFYEGVNYVGFEAPALAGDQIWVLPDSDGNANEVLVTDGSGNLSFSDLINSYTNTFIDGDLSSGELTITHSLGTKNVIVNIYDNDDELIMPDEIITTDTNTVTIDLTSYGTLTGKWRYVIIASTSSVVSANVQTLIRDADEDTKIDVESSTDLDEIVATVAGTEAFRIHDNGIIDLPKQSRVRAYVQTQTIPNSSWTKLELANESYDEQGEFDNVTNYRFTAVIPGYYQVNGAVSFTTATAGEAIIEIYKNGSSVARGGRQLLNASMPIGINVSDVIYLNGSTDYIELYVYQSSGGTLNTENLNYVNYMSIHKLS